MDIINTMNMFFLNHCKYIKIQKFYKKEDMIMINNIINKLKCEKYYKHSNNYLFNDKRKQYILYQNNLISDIKKNETILKSHFKTMKNILYEPLKIAYLKSFCDNVENVKDFCLERISYIEVSPGCVEQPPHTDPLPIKNEHGMYYITVALEDTPKEMGGTIVYNYEEIKNVDDLKQIDSKLLYSKKKLLVLNSGDINIHNNLTVHHGAANNSNKIRKFLFIVFTIRNQKYKNEVLITENFINNEIISSIDIIRKKKPLKLNSEIDFYNENKYIYLPQFFDNDIFQNIKSIIFDLYNNNQYSHYSNNWFNTSVDNNTRQKIFLYIKKIISRNKQEDDEIQNHFDSVYNRLKEPLSCVISKIKKLQNTDYVSIDRIVLFNVKPGEKEQNMHLDGPINMDNKPEPFNQCYVNIPLQDTPFEMGGTAFYKTKYTIKYKNELTKKYNDGIGYGDGFGYYNKLKGEKMNDFKRARQVIKYNERDIAIHNNHCLHNGTANNTNKTRQYLFLVIHTKKSELIPISPVKIIKYKNFKCIDIMSDEEINEKNFKDNMNLKYGKEKDKLLSASLPGAKWHSDKKDPMVDFFNKKKYVIIKQFFSPKEIYQTIDIIYHLKKYNELSKTSNNWGNNYIINSNTPNKRVQTFLYARLDHKSFTAFKDIESQKKCKIIQPIIEEHYEFIASLLRPNILQKVTSLIERLFGNIKWTISRITAMDIYHGCEEQQIHLDGKDSDSNGKELYLMIPLVNHDKNMGGTIFYDNEIVEKYKVKNKLNFGYFNDLRGEMRKDFEKAKIFKPVQIGDITVHTNETLHGGAENKSNKLRKAIFIIITVGGTDDNYMGNTMSILKSKKTNDLSLTIIRGTNKLFTDEEDLEIMNPNEYKNQYDILPDAFVNNIYHKGFYIINNKILEKQVDKFTNLIGKIREKQQNHKAYSIWLKEGFSGNPYILHDKREMIELYQSQDILNVTLNEMVKYGETYGKEDSYRIRDIHYDNMCITYNIMLHIMPLMFNVIRKLNYTHFNLVNVKYYNILSGGKDQQLHCDGTHVSKNVDNIQFIYSLQDTKNDMGGTNYYLNHKLDDKWKNINSNDEESKCIGFIEDLKDKEMFYKAEHKVLLKRGELSVHLHNTIHKGCGNTSKKAREFLFFLVRAYK